MEGLRVAVLCVADSKTKYLYQSLRLVVSVTHLQSRHELTPFVGYFEGAPDYFLELLKRLDAKALRLERYSESHGPSNKLSILKIPELEDYDAVILCDCDLILVEEFDDLIERDGFQAKIADEKTLPDSTLMDVFNVANRPFPAARFITTIDRLPSILYCNAGFVIFSKSLFKPLVERWFLWNELLLKEANILGRLTFFTDQASFSLAAEEFSNFFRELGVAMNYPLHLSEDQYPPEVRAMPAKVIHYHDAVDPKSGAINLTGHRRQHGAISSFNRTFSSYKELISGPAFWDFLFSSVPIASEREEPFYRYRSGLVRQIIQQVSPKSVIDLGCGRSPLLGGADVLSYTGVDYSSEAISSGIRADPLGKYVQVDIANYVQSTADLVLLLDVLPYLSRAEDLGVAARRAAEAAEVALVISGLERPMESWNRPPSFFHQPIEGITDLLSDFEFRRIGSANDQAFYFGRRSRRD